MTTLYTQHNTFLHDFDEIDDTQVMASLPILNMVTVGRDECIPNILEINSEYPQCPALLE